MSVIGPTPCSKLSSFCAQTAKSDSHVSSADFQGPTSPRISQQYTSIDHRLSILILSLNTLRLLRLLGNWLFVAVALVLLATFIIVATLRSSLLTGRFRRSLLLATTLRSSRSRRSRSRSSLGHWCFALGGALDRRGRVGACTQVAGREQTELLVVVLAVNSLATSRAREVFEWKLILT